MHYLIGFDGPDGCGKSTVLKYVHNTLQYRTEFSEYKFRCLCFPGQTQAGRVIRGILSSDDGLPSHVQAMLFAADNAMTFNDYVDSDEFKNENTIWLTDRTWFSSVIYQGEQGVTRQEIRDLQEPHMVKKYDRIYFFDVDDRIAQERLKSRGQPLDWLEAVDEGKRLDRLRRWKQLAKSVECGKTVNANRAVEEIGDEIAIDIYRKVVFDN
jgi:thymidylate kinase